jgi:hypothetical protein
LTVLVVYLAVCFVLSLAITIRLHWNCPYCYPFNGRTLWRRFRDGQGVGRGH